MPIFWEVGRLFLTALGARLCMYLFVRGFVKVFYRLGVKVRPTSLLEVILYAFLAATGMVWATNQWFTPWPYWSILPIGLGLIAGEFVEHRIISAPPYN